MKGRLTGAHLRAAWRRRGWLLDLVRPATVANMALAGAELLARRRKLLSWPVVVKVDISPLCNLRCPVCLHAAPHGLGGLETQDFHAGQRMTVPQFRRIVEEIAGRTSAVSLYTVGDPLVHPDLDAMCRIARDAGLGVHLSTNFSFALREERLRALLGNGTSHLTVCVDGLTQEVYEENRVGGRLDLVLRNLEAAFRIRRETRSRHPRIEVQWVRYPWNENQIGEAEDRFLSMGADRFEWIHGDTRNWAETDADRFLVLGTRAPGWLPLCPYPWTLLIVKWNGDVFPCCEHRVGAQYSTVLDPRVVGNVFRSGVREVWNSPAYQALRALAAEPDAVPEGEARPAYCYACARLYRIERPPGGIPIRGGH